jgi:hypothetical protein
MVHRTRPVDHAFASSATLAALRRSRLARAAGAVRLSSAPSIFLVRRMAGALLLRHPPSVVGSRTGESALTTMRIPSPRVVTFLALAILLSARTLPVAGQHPLIERAERTASLLEAVDRDDPLLDEEALPDFEALESLLGELDEYLADHPDDVAGLLLSVRLGRFTFSIRDEEEGGGMSASVSRGLARLDRVLELQPSSALAHHLRALLLAGRGLSGPLGLFDVTADVNAWEAWSREAIEPARRAVELDPGTDAYGGLLRDLLQLHGRFDEARAEAAALPDADGWDRVAAPFEIFALPPGGAYWITAAAGIAGVLAVAEAMGGGTIPSHPGARVRVYLYPLALDPLAEIAREAVGDQEAFRTLLDPDEEATVVPAIQEAFFWSGERLVRRAFRDGDSPALVVLLFEHPVEDEEESFSHLGPLPLPGVPPALRDRFALQEGDRFSVLVALSGWSLH